MNEGLEALYRMIYNGYVHPDCKELKIIEKELKRLEEIDDCFTMEQKLLRLENKS